MIEELREKGEKGDAKKKKPKEAWGMVILISFLVFIVSQFINVCISRLQGDTELQDDYRTYRTPTKDRNKRHGGDRRNRRS